MKNEIVFDKAHIAAVEHRIAGGNVTSRIKVVAMATAKIAKAIGARWLLDREALVKSGFTSVDLDYEIKSLRARHDVEKIHAFETTSELAHRFRVFRRGNDKKKPGKRLMVSFTVEHSGSPFDILEHLLKVGSGEGIYTLIPLQSEMFPEPAPNGKPKVTLKERAHAIHEDVDKKRSAKRKKHKRRQPKAMPDVVVASPVQQQVQQHDREPFG